MALNSINTNVAAYFAQQNIGKANNMTSSSIGRLSSGNRIVRASDDVAAMAVGTSLRTTVSTLKVGLLNASQGTSMLQVADGALGKMQDMLLRQKTLATQATSGTLTGSERTFLNQEFQNLTEEIDRLVENTNFNGVNLLSGTLGNTAVMAGTDAIAGALVVEGSIAVSNRAMEAFADDGTTLFNAAPAAAGQINFASDSTGTAATNADFEVFNPAATGDISEFTISDITEGVSARITVTVGSVEFSAIVANAAGAGSFVLSNGNTHLEFGHALGTADFSDLQSAQAGIQALNADYDGARIMMTSSVQGANFEGTRLEGVTGNANSSAPMLRLADMSDTSIRNFEYVSNDGTVNSSTVSVEIGGNAFYASVEDFPLAPADANGTVISFTDGFGQVLQLDLTGLDSDFDFNVASDNIRTNEESRDSFINALNDGFANIGGGVDFALGSEITDKLTVAIRKSDTAALFGNQSLDVTTVGNAQIAGQVLNDAIDRVTSVRADVGALMSRFDFASANIEIALQNQDAARGTLLDTDVSAESTAYATAQVQLQAGIAVLAQANQLPQNLLKLLG